MRLAWHVVDQIHNLFAIPHDWAIIDRPTMAVLKRLAPRTAAYYGNPFCYAYCTLVANWFYRVERWLGEAADKEVS